jgi:mono/diheme cytochrome c family protein
MWAACVLGLLTLSGCRTDMWVQQRVEAQGNSEFYALTEQLVGPDGKTYGSGSRPMPPNTIARGHLRDPNDPLLTGKDAQGNQLNTLPPPLKLTREFLQRGQEQYNAFCSPCHGMAGDGKGMIALRGQWPRMPSSLVDARLQSMPLGYFYSVATNGFGIMYGYGKRMPPEDRWAIAAYIRVLQLSQSAKFSELPPEDQQKALEALQKQMESSGTEVSQQ